MVTDIEKLARELIALPSVNPAFLPKNDPDAGEMRVSDFLAATAAKAGLEVDLQEVLPGRRNVLARLTPPGKIKQRILLAPHGCFPRAVHSEPASRAHLWPRRLRHQGIRGRNARRFNRFGAKWRAPGNDRNRFRWCR